MMPIGPLMIEHRLIERMIAQLKRRLDALESTGEIDPGFVDEAVDFIRSYADRCHHGKEEDILFRELGTRALSGEHRRVMDELVQEHKHARETVGALVAATRRYRDGDRGAAADIAAALRELVGMYPAHIEKEDKHFFVPVMSYFTKAEQDAMLEEGHELDRKLIHERFGKVVEDLEQS